MRCFLAPERGDISKNSGILPVRGKGDFCATDGLVGLARKERNYDYFDDQRYNEVDDVEVRAHNVCFNAPPRYIVSQFETEIIAESGQNGKRGAQGCKYLFCKRLD